MSSIPGAMSSYVIGIYAFVLEVWKIYLTGNCAFRLALPVVKLVHSFILLWVSFFLIFHPIICFLLSYAHIIKRTVQWKLVTVKCCNKYFSYRCQTWRHELWWRGHNDAQAEIAQRSCAVSILWLVIPFYLWRKDSLQKISPIQVPVLQ